jgi:hypothetical protein
MSAGKRRRQEPIRGSSDSEEEDDSIYDLTWEPEGGSVFKVPLHEFYNRKSEIPERFKGAPDWTTECLVGTLQGTKRSNNLSRRRRACYPASSSTTAMRRHMVPPDIGVGGLLLRTGQP